MAADLHIYVSDELYKEVKEAELPVSKIAQNALTRELAKRWVVDTALDAEELEIELWTSEEQLYTATFMGTWLLEPDSDTTQGEGDGYNADLFWGVALLEGGDFLVYAADENARLEPGYEIVDDLEDGDLPVNVFVGAALAFNKLLTGGNQNARWSRDTAYEVRVPLDLS